VKIRPPPPLRFVVLLPHRDTQGFLRDYRRRLFAAGVDGAYSFPPAAPLALVSRPCRPGELRALAFSLRGLTLAEGGGGRIRAAGGAAVECPGDPGGPDQGFALWGLSLRTGLPLNAGPLLPPDALVFPFPAPVLCAALLGRAGPGNPGRDIAEAVPLPPAFFFRAASVANLIWSPLTGETGTRPGRDYSRTWKTGKPCWLPRC
jgi:hypothetical protein